MIKSLRMRVLRSDGWGLVGGADGVEGDLPGVGYFGNDGMFIAAAS
jgi:hypothetical protein